MSKRKLAEGMPAIAAVEEVPILIANVTPGSTTTSPFAVRPEGIYKVSKQDEAEHGAALEAAAASEQSPIKRINPPPGSPAAAFNLKPNVAIQDADQQDLTCDFTSLHPSRWNKRRTLSAVIIAVLPIKIKGSSVRRNIVLRDQFGECTACIWGNHTRLINESAVGRAITCQRVCLREYNDAVQLHMPKDSSVTVGQTHKTIPILEWLHTSGNTAITVQDAISLNATSIFATHGIVAQVIDEKITTKDGTIIPRTTVIIANGPPNAFLPIQFWDPLPEQVVHWHDLLHEAVKVTMIRCQLDGQQGNKYTSIRTITKIAKKHDATLEEWWFKPADK